MGRVYVIGSVIAALSACTLMGANKAMRAGKFGRLIYRGRAPYAALAAVEAHIGPADHPGAACPRRRRPSQSHSGHRACAGRTDGGF